MDAITPSKSHVRQSACRYPRDARDDLPRSSVLPGKFVRHWRSTIKVGQNFGAYRLSTRCSTGMQLS